MTAQERLFSFLGVIPARGGSKGVPRKNIRIVAGKPLLVWTIEAAKRSKRLERWVVSTEDAEIAKIARQHGAEVLPRPPQLASDEADTLCVLQHALEEIPAETVVVLAPTSPIRRDGLIDVCIEKFEAEGADSLGTVHRDYSYEYGQDMPRRQEIQPRLVDNGNVYVIRADLVLAGRQIGNRLGVFETTREEGIEVDDEFDLWLAEHVLLYRLPISIGGNPKV
jgi:N-acylneuraminate cytidylyltransferase